MKSCIHINADARFQFNCDVVIPDGDLLDPASHQFFITTDANGEGIYTVTKDNGNKELTYGKTYTLLQTAGDSRYSLADAADVIINDTLSRSGARI